MGATRRGLVLGGLALAAPALAQADWPQRPVRMVIPYPPGGASDIIARLMAPHLTASLGQTLIVENRPGANGFIAAELVARSVPDGYTLLMGNAGPNGMGPALYGSRTPFDPIADFMPVMAVSIVPQIMAVNPAVPVRSFPEFLAYAKEQAGRMSYGSAGVGSPVRDARARPISPNCTTSMIFGPPGRTAMRPGISPVRQTAAIEASGRAGTRPARAMPATRAPGATRWVALSVASAPARPRELNG